MKKYKCSICGYIYDPEKGDPEAAIVAGTAFEDLPEDWTCPVCRVGKEAFVEVVSADDDEDFGDKKNEDKSDENDFSKASKEEEQIAPKNDTRIEENADS